MVNNACRINGFSKPYSREQKSTWVLWSLCTIAFYIGTVIALWDDKYKTELITCLTIYSVLVITFLILWYLVETIDPAEPGGIPCVCMSKTQSQKHYCTLCYKHVQGLDHHCMWLNTCIGKRNYPIFFALITFGTIQFGAQTLVNILIFLDWRFKDESIIFAIVFAIQALIAGIVTAFWARVGTYDWLLARQAAAFRARKEAAKQKRLNRTENVKNGVAPSTTSSSALKTERIVLHTVKSKTEGSDLNNVTVQVEDSKVKDNCTYHKPSAILPTDLN